MAPAKTGSDVIRRTAVIAIDHNISGKRSSDITLVVREQMIVVRKLIEPRIDEIPAT